MEGINLTGLTETVKELRKYEPELIRELQKSLRVSAMPLAVKVGQHFPKVPLKNWVNDTSKRSKGGFPRYVASEAQKSVKPSALRGSPNFKGATTVLRLETSSASASVYDGAGRKTASQFVSNLDKHSKVQSKKNKIRSRVLYGVTLGNKEMIEEGMLVTIKRIDALVQSHLAQHGAKF